MPADFYAYVRGQTDVVPDGYTPQGMRVYRHLVYLGASQMIASHHPELPAQLGDEAWRALIEDFVRQSAWASHFYGDLHDEFIAYLERTRAQAD